MAVNYWQLDPHSQLKHLALIRKLSKDAFYPMCINVKHSMWPTLLLLGIISLETFVAAQTATSTATRTARSNATPMVSPEVHADRTVTFRVRAAKANQVSVSGEFGNHAMTQSNGVWSVTIGPLKPDLYGYGFDIDGFRTLDPVNSAIKPMRSPTTSILDVPDDKPLMHDFQPSVPHGAVCNQAYFSKSLGKLRQLAVYLPPGYLKNLNQYPVLYLLHGSGDNQATWTALGRAQFIMDNLIAQGKAKPMIIVMTDGHASFAQPNATDGRNQNVMAYQRDLLEDVMPLVESNYRIINDRESRAIIGLSMGGGQSLFIGLNRLDLFAWVGGMSSSVREPEKNMSSVLADPQAMNARLRLLWFACGKDDFLLDANKQFDQLLTDKGVRHEFMLTEGNHSWPVWRRYLVDFAPRLFVK